MESTVEHLCGTSTDHIRYLLLEVSFLVDYILYCLTFCQKIQGEIDQLAGHVPPTRLSAKILICVNHG